MPDEDVLRETFATYADRAPRGDGLAAAARGRAKVAARRRARVTVAAAAASVAVVAYGAVALAPRGDDGRPVPPVASEPVPARHPDLTQRVYSGGLEFYVPGHWPLNEQGCAGVPTADTVLTYETSTFCMTMEPPGLSVARVLRVENWSGALQEIREQERRETTLQGGHGAELVSGVHERSGRAVRAVVVPTMLHAVWVVSPDADLAARIVSTVRVVDVDWQGCAPRVAPTPPEAPRVAGATERLVPDGARSAVACRYTDDGVLQEWQGLGPAAAAELAGLLNGLPRGFADPPPAENIACEKYPYEPVVVTFDYGDGRLPVHVNFTGCERLGASNGAMHGAATDALVAAVGRLVGDGFNASNRWDDFRND
jgi:hypothetical protein